MFIMNIVMKAIEAAVITSRRLGRPSAASTQAIRLHCEVVSAQKSDGGPGWFPEIFKNPKKNAA
jgi:hypothetical protein